MNYLKIYTDGGARGNPGPAAYGLVVKNQQGKIIYQQGKKIGQTTNNQAEYNGLIAGLKWLVDNSPQVDQVDFFLDSRLIVNQLQGNFKVKSANLKVLWDKAKQLANKIEVKIYYHYVPRELNSEADGLLNKALDK